MEKFLAKLPTISQWNSRVTQRHRIVPRAKRNIKINEISNIYNDPKLVAASSKFFPFPRISLRTRSNFVRNMDDISTKLLIGIHDVSKFHWILETNAARDCNRCVYWMELALELSRNRSSNKIATVRWAILISTLFSTLFSSFPYRFPFRNYLPRCSYNFFNKLIDAVTMLKISLVNNFYFVFLFWITFQTLIQRLILFGRQETQKRIEERGKERSDTRVYTSEANFCDVRIKEREHELERKC